MGREEEIVQERLKKIKEMQKQGIVPYSYRFDKKDNCFDLQEEFKKLENEKFGRETSVAGRIMSIRDIGKIIFSSLQDKTGTIQIVLQEEKTPEKQMELFKKFADSGDILGISGKVFRTKRGELSILAEKIEILTKSIKSLPDKFHGFKDDEEKLRKRYLDIIMSQEVKDQNSGKQLEAFY